MSSCIVGSKSPQNKKYKFPNRSSSKQISSGDIEINSQKTIIFVHMFMPVWWTVGGGGGGGMREDKHFVNHALVSISVKKKKKKFIPMQVYMSIQEFKFQKCRLEADIRLGTWYCQRHAKISTMDCSGCSRHCSRCHQDNTETAYIIYIRIPREIECTFFFIRIYTL